MRAAVSITCSGRGMRSVRARARGRGAVGGADGAWLAPLRSASARLGALRRRRELPSAKVAWRCPTWRRHWPRASPARGTDLRLAFRAAAPELPSPGTPPARPEPDPCSGGSSGGGFPGGDAARGGSAAAQGFLKPWATRRAWKGKGSPKGWPRRQRRPEEGLAGRGAPCAP